MEFQRASTTEEEMEVLPWLGYAAFHLGDYRKALEAYQAWQSTGEAPEEVHLYIGCCYFYLQQYAEAEAALVAEPPAAPEDTHELGSSCKRLAVSSGLFCIIASAVWRRARLGGVEAAPWCSTIASEE